MKKRRKWLRALSTLVVICLLGVGGMYAWQTWGAKAASVGVSSTSNSSGGGTYTVQRMSFSVDISGNGTLTPTTTTTAKAPFAGEIVSVSAQDGDVVSAGDVLFTIDPEGIKEEIVAIEESILAKDKEIAEAGASSTSGSITAPIAGRIKKIYAEEDDDVVNRMAQSGALCMMSSDGKMCLSFTPEAGATVTLGSKLVAVLEVEEDDETVEVEEDCVIESIDDDGVVTVTIANDEYEIGKEAMIENLDGVTVGSGTLSVNRPVYVVGGTGVISSVRYEEDDKVSSGTTLFKLTGTMLDATFESLILEREQLVEDLAEAKEKLDQLSWTAPSDGVVTAITLAAGDTVLEDDVLYTIQNNDAFQIVIAIDELDITSVELGQTATVTVPALSDATYSATVTHISSSGYTESSVTTYDVTLLLSNVENIRSGMNAEASVQTVSRSNVLVVPASAIQSSNGNKLVDVVTTGSSGITTTTAAIVTVGTSNGTYVEITAGLNEGDVVSTNTSNDSSATNALGIMGMVSGDMGGGMAGGGGMPSGEMPSRDSMSSGGGFPGGSSSSGN